MTEGKGKASSAKMTRHKNKCIIGPVVRRLLTMMFDLPTPEADAVLGAI